MNKEVLEKAKKLDKEILFIDKAINDMNTSSKEIRLVTHNTIFDMAYWREELIDFLLYKKINFRKESWKNYESK